MVIVDGTPALSLPSTSKPWAWISSSWSLVTTRVSVSPFLRSTVEGAGVTFLPLIVMVIDRPAGVGSLAGGGVVGVLADGGVVALPAGVLGVAEVVLAVAVVVVAGAAGVSVSPPQAVTASASAAPTAYPMALGSVIFVTRCSLNSAF